MNMDWKTFTPLYGLDRSLRPLRANLQRRRTPSHFRSYTAQVSA